MHSTLPVLLNNINSLRKREGKRPLTKGQIAQVKEQVAQRLHYGHYSLFNKTLTF